MDGCLFCAIVADEVPADIVARTEHTVAFRDIAPQAPTHVLVVPRHHCRDALELSANPTVAGHLLADAAEVARSLGLEPSGDDGADGGFRIVINTGSRAGQSVFHVHAHVFGGRPMAWPPG